MKQETSRKQLMEYTFQQYEKLGVPRLLDPEDFDNINNDSNNKTASIDKKSVMTYVMCIFRKMHVPSSSTNDHSANGQGAFTDKSLETNSAISSGINGGSIVDIYSHKINKYKQSTFEIIV